VVAISCNCLDLIRPHRHAHRGAFSLTDRSKLLEMATPSFQHAPWKKSLDQDERARTSIRIDRERQQGDSAITDRLDRVNPFEL